MFSQHEQTFKKNQLLDQTQRIENIADLELQVQVSFMILKIFVI